MGTQQFNYTLHKLGPHFGLNSLSHGQFRSFNTEMLNLGNLSQEGTTIEALAAIYDLQGFTRFCNQDDPHLVVPEFLTDFLSWLFRRIAQGVEARIHKGRHLIWGNLPFSAKFLGDGVLFLWDVHNPPGIGIGGPTGLGTVALVQAVICESYREDFLPKARKRYPNPPEKLRCGLARGRVISIGDGEDYVGACINMAARLQKLSSLTYVLSTKGISEKAFPNPTKKLFVKKRVSIRGIKDECLVYVLREEFNKLEKPEAECFSDP